jgi:hypothetical protein
VEHAGLDVQRQRLRPWRLQDVKINFFKGAAITDRERLFNGGLDAKASRSIDLVEGDAIDEPALQELVRAAATLND